MRPRPCSCLAFIKEGDALERWSLRGPVFVIVAILAFALTIRPFSLRRPLTIPGLGLLVAGPLAIIIGGYATPEARLRDLVILALSLTPFCMVLFGDLLNLPIPVFPQASPVFSRLTGRRRPSCGPPLASWLSRPSSIFLTDAGRRPAAIDVADHSGRI